MGDEGFVSGEEVDPEDEDEITEEKLGKAFRKPDDKLDGDIAFADSDSDLGSASGDEFGDEESSDEDGGAARWKKNMLETAHQLHGKKRSFRTSDLAKLMYDESLTATEVLTRWRGEVEEEEEDIEESDDETFFKKSVVKLLTRKSKIARSLFLIMMPSKRSGLLRTILKL